MRETGKDLQYPLMKAATCRRYGPPEVLQIESLPRPRPSADQVLIRVMASSVNSGDVRVRGLLVGGFLRVVMRVVLGLYGPRKPIQGMVYAGVVEETGKDVRLFRPGDEVWGMTGLSFGTHAEFKTVHEKSVIARKPASLTFEEAASIPFGLSTAKYFLDKCGLPGLSTPRVLIYGATGSVGVSALQLARANGAHVVAVCSERGEQLARSLGAHEIILYTKQSIADMRDSFDIVFDAVGKTRRKQVKHLLNGNGRYATVGGLDTAVESSQQLNFAAGLVEAGLYRPVIDRIYDLDDIVEAHRYVESGRKKGDVVLRIGA